MTVWRIAAFLAACVLMSILFIPSSVQLPSHGWNVSLLKEVSLPTALADEERPWVIVALINSELHLRIFYASGKKVDKAEDELVGEAALTALKQRVDRYGGQSIYDGQSISPVDKDEILRNVELVANLTLIQTLYLGLMSIKYRRKPISFVMLLLVGVDEPAMKN